MTKKLDATKVLIAINVVFFVFTYFIASTKEFFENAFPLYFPLNEDFQPWQFLSHIFMHGSPLHLFMNMFGLFMFGSLLEKMWGSKRFLIFYFCVGIGAGLVYSTVNYIEFNSAQNALIETGISQETIDEVLFEEMWSIETNQLFSKRQEEFRAVAAPFFTTAVGASGAVYGILTAFGMLFPNAKLSLIFLPVPVAAKYFIPGLLTFDLLSGLTGFSVFGGGVGIAHFAHIGGALIGFIIMMVFKRQLPAPVYHPPTYET